MQSLGDSTAAAATAVSEEMQKMLDGINDLVANDATFATMLYNSGTSVEMCIRDRRSSERTLSVADIGQDTWDRLQIDSAKAESELNQYKQTLTESIIKQNAANSAIGKAGEKLERVGTCLLYTSRCV